MNSRILDHKNGTRDHILTYEMLKNHFTPRQKDVILTDVLIVLASIGSLPLKKILTSVRTPTVTDAGA